MGNVVDFGNWKRARHHRRRTPGRALPQRGERGHHGFVSIGMISAELVRRLTEE